MIDRAAFFIGCLALVSSSASYAATPELRVALAEEPDSVNPLTGTLVVDNDISALVYDGLTRFDDRRNQIPDLAEAVPTLKNGGISADGKVLTYHLVRNARWHDGVPVTSRDVAFSLAAYRNPKLNAGSNSHFDNIVRIETPDKRTVRIVLTRPWAPALTAFAGGSNGVVLPEHLLSAKADLNRVDFVDPEFGSGPYSLTAWHRGSDMTFAANPSYFRGVPHIARIRLVFLENGNTMVTAIRSGAIDLADNVSVSTYEAARGAPLKTEMNARSSWDHLTFNTSKGPLADVRVRRALCYGFDADRIFTTIYHGLGVRGPVAENPRTSWYDSQLHYYAYSPSKAAALLDAAGWHLGSDGLRERDGRPLSLTFVTTAGNQTREQAQIFLQSSWQQIGIGTIIKNAPAAVLYAPASSGGLVYSGKFDVALNGIVSAADPSLWDINSSDAVPPKGQNLSWFADPELTSLENRAASTYDVASRKRLYDHIQEIELSDLPYYVLRWNEIISMHAPRLHGVHPSMTESTFWNVASWSWN